MSKKFFIDSPIDDYLVFLKDIKNLSDNSIKAYKRDILKFRNFLISNKINKLTPGAGGANMSPGPGPR